MADTAVLPEDRFDTYIPIKPERLAWMVLVFSLGTFCTICVVSSIVLQYFFFQSSVPMSTLLQAGRGTLSVREGNDPLQAESFQRFLSRTTTISTDRTDTSSQATIILSDTSLGEPVIASVTLRGGTSLTFEHASRPRFDWSVPIYDVEFTALTGRIDITVESGLRRDIKLRVLSPSGAEARIGSPGRYVFEATESSIRLVNYSGEAILIAPDRQTASSIPENGQGIMMADDNTIVRSQALVELLTNGALITYSTEEVGGNLASQPLGWSCVNTADELPEGDIRADVAPDGRKSWRLVRAEGAGSHAETRCEQTLGNPQAGLGVNVSNYNYLSLRATLYIESQSLSACGEVGSECPLMFTIDYINAAGEVKSRTWFHGIYAFRDPGVDYPSNCPGCPRDHLFIYEDSWYIYDSGNLFELLPERPVAITKVIFYASGHQYDVYLDEISLMGGNLASSTPNVTTTNNS